MTRLPRLPRTPITRTPSGWLLTCAAPGCDWERHITRRPAADRAAHEHRASHARKDKT